MSGIMERCEGRWHDLLMMLGVDRRHLTGRHGPCPMCGGRDRFRFDNKQNRGTWICNVCGAGDGAALVMKLKGWDFKTLANELEQCVGRAQQRVVTARTSSQRQQAEMQRIWAQARPVQHGDPVDLYLRSRGLELPRFPALIRYAPQCWHKHEQANYPAMIARVDAGESLSQLHKTFVTEAGEKARVEPERLFHWGPFLDGSAVRLGTPVDVLGIAEGLETALSAALAHRLPVWAALTAKLLMKWNPPDGVREVHIFGDNDDNYTGQAASYSLANRLSVQRSDLRVRVHVPEQAGDDWNDVYARLNPEAV